MAEIKASLTTGANDAGWMAANYRWLYFTFTPDAVWNLYSTKIQVKKVGTISTDIILELYLADVNHKPTGSVLSDGTISAGSITTSASWLEGVMDSYEVSIGQEYCVVGRTTGGDDGGNEYEWSRANPGTTSDYGAGVSTDGGSTWSVLDLDYMFEVWGNPLSTAYTVSHTDTIVVSDMEEQRFEASISKTDILNLSEIPKEEARYSKSFSDNLTLSDYISISRVFGLVVLDIITLSEPVKRLKSIWNKSFSDAITLTDSIKSSQLFSIIKTEVLTLTDAITKKSTWAKIFTETIILKDIVAISSSAWTWMVKHTASWTHKVKSASPTWTFKTKHK